MVAPAGSGARKSAHTRFHNSYLKIITGSNLSRRRLPWMRAEAPADGPTVWLTACGHGDEVGGMVVIQELFRKLRRGRLLQGKVLAFPLMNPIGFEAGSRTVIVSEEDLNRCFPGERDGSFAQRIAYKIFSTIVGTGPDLVLDLHNDWIKSIPYAVLDPAPGATAREGWERARNLARLSGLPAVVEAEVVPHSLSWCLLKACVPALTLELGESHIVNEANIASGLGAVWNILAALDMVSPDPVPFASEWLSRSGTRILRYWDRPLASSSGIVRFLVGPGDRVEAGQEIARIHDAFGKLQESVPAAYAGIVLGHVDSSVAFPGLPIMTFAILPQRKATVSCRSRSVL